MDKYETINPSRIELRCDGKLILGTSIEKRPKNSVEMVKLLKFLITMIESAPSESIHHLL
jgi:hypothetical protein